jgi:hypothetical protein
MLSMKREVKKMMERLFATVVSLDLVLHGQCMLFSLSLSLSFFLSFFLFFSFFLSFFLLPFSPLISFFHQRRWIYGFFFPLFWFYGISYLMSDSQSHRRAALVNALSFALFVCFAVVAYVVLPLTHAPIEAIWGMSVAYGALCMLAFVVVTCVVARDRRSKRRERAQVRERLKRNATRVFTVLHNPNGVTRQERESFVQLNV